MFKQRYFFPIIALGICWQLQAQNDSTSRQIALEEIVVSSVKETNEMKTLPASVSVITAHTIEDQNIVSIKGLSAIMPNFFIADYGSKFSTPVYIRGIGARSTGQSIGMYVDNMSYLNPSTFDFEFMDVQRIEVLRGPQGTLYGRNAMSGIVHVFTHSPLTLNRTKITLSTGNYGLFRAKASVSKPVGKHLCISASGYYDRNDGYFTNTFTGSKADRLQSAGGRLRLDGKIGNHWLAQLSVHYDYTDQGAFPYGAYNNGDIALPDYNYAGLYLRKTGGAGLNLQYGNERIIFNSATGFHQLNDRMQQDVDYRPLDVFQLNQRQKETSWTEELTLKSNTKHNYQWSIGLFGFYSDLYTDSPVTFKEKGINTLEEIFVELKNQFPAMPTLSISDDELYIPTQIKTPCYGVAVFHQFTYNNLFFNGLSMTGGLRLDGEKQRMEYTSAAKMKLAASMGGRPPVDVSSRYDTTVIDVVTTQDFLQLLPKVSVKYEWTNKTFVYLSVAKGYKTGGYNVQMASDVMRAHMQYDVMKAFEAMFPPNLLDKYKPENAAHVMPYKPEYSWNYEAGFKGSLVKDALYAELAVFYIDVRDIQLTEFVASGQGRILKNAGKARSYGIEAGLNAKIAETFSLSLNYGFTRATFGNYHSADKDYTGNVIPFAPQNTLSLNAQYRRSFSGKWIDHLSVRTHYNAAGRIYWTEANEVYQNFYGTLNTKVTVNKGIFGLSLWTNNTLNARYASFYFESSELGLAQRGRPFTFGTDLSITF
ncbi:MAG: TonB-dependent receptor [Bacteroidales bacterium]|jgi:outer membrane receptor protein involved in Fe transport|nr:TonB-dependent receptor [Bacteroidales bacterium]